MAAGEPAGPEPVAVPTQPDLSALGRTDLASTAATGAVVMELDARGVAGLHLFGFADRDEAEPLTPSWRFHLGSAGGLLAAILALELEGAGELDLEAPVADQVTGLRPGVGAPALSHLLLHTAGFDASPLAPFSPGAEPPALSPEASLPLLREWVILAPPGSFRSTSPHHTLLADHALEVVGGAPLAELVRRWVPGGGGVEGGSGGRLPAGVRGGHLVSQTVEGPYLPAPLPDPALLPFRERFWVTPDALAGAVGAILRDPERLAALAWPRAVALDDPEGAEPWGLAFRRVAGTERWVLQGRSEGHTVVVHLLPREGRAILVVANGVGSPMERVVGRLLEGPAGARGALPGAAPIPARAEAEARPPAPILALLDAPPPPLAVERVTQPDPAMAGTYRNGSELFHLRVVDGVLAVDPGSALPLVLFPTEGGALEARIGDGRLAMTLHLFRDGEGEAWAGYGGLLFRREAPEEG